LHNRESQRAERGMCIAPRSVNATGDNDGED
jgi:hypothetical protein